MARPRPRLGRTWQRAAGAGGSILLVLGSPVSLVLQSRLGGEGGFPTRDQLEAGPLHRGVVGDREAGVTGRTGGRATLICSWLARGTA